MKIWMLQVATVVALAVLAVVWLLFGAGYPAVRWGIYSVLGMWTCGLALRRANEQISKRDAMQRQNDERPISDAEV